MGICEFFRNQGDNKPDEETAEFRCEAGPPFDRPGVCAEETGLDWGNRMIRDGYTCSGTAKGSPCPVYEGGDKTQVCTKILTLTCTKKNSSQSFK